MIRRFYSHWSADALLGFFLSRVFPTGSDGATFVVPPLMCLVELSSQVAPGEWLHCTSECYSTAVVASSLSRAPYPCEVPRLLRSHRFGAASILGHGFP
jgi:hypothetical protein